MDWVAAICVVTGIWLVGQRASNGFWWIACGASISAILQIRTEPPLWGLATQSAVVDFYWLAVPRELQDEAVKRAKEIGAGVFLVYWHDWADDVALCDKIKEPQRWLTKDAAPLINPYHHHRSVKNIKEWRHSLQSKVWRLAALRYWDIVRDRNLDREEKKGA